MAVNAVLRTDATALIPEQITREIIQGAVTSSAVLSLFKKLPNMSSDKTSMPVLDSLPMAYWVNGDTGQKQTTKMQWDKKYIYAAELAVIVPIPEAVLADSNYDIWGEIRPRLVEAFAVKIDDAILFGVDKPTQWRASVVDTAIAAGNVVTESTDFYGDVFGKDGVIAVVEKDGYRPNGIIADISMLGELRGLRDTTGRPLFSPSLKESSAPYTLEGMPIFIPENGTWDITKAKMIVGNMSQAVYSIRQDITYKMLTESVIQDSNGDIIYNLAQMDMVALRAVMRLGWEIPNPINRMQQDESQRCPFGVYVPEEIEP